MDGQTLKARAERWIRIWDFCCKTGDCDACELGKVMPGVVRCQSHLLAEAEEIIRGVAAREDKGGAETCKEPG